MRLLSVLSALLVVSVNAVFQDEAYHLDYHHALLGQPIQSSTFFHQPNPDSKASLIYTITEEAVIGAVNPKDGALVWRQALPGAKGSLVKLLKPIDGQDVLISAIDGEVSAWKASSGKLIWTHQTGDAPIREVESLFEVGSPVQIIVLTAGKNTLVSLDIISGNVNWGYEDPNGDVPHGLSVGTNTVYYLSLHKVTLSGYKIRVTSFNARDGSQVQQRLLASDNEATEPGHVFFIGSTPAIPVVAWTNSVNGVIKMNIIGTDRLSIFEPPRSLKIESFTVVAPRGAHASPHFLIQTQTAKENLAEVFTVKIDQGQVVKEYEMGTLFGKGAFAASTSGSEVFFTRVVKGGISVFSPTDKNPIERYLLDDYSIPGVLDFPEPLQVISEVQPRSGTRPAVRSAILFASGDWIMNLNGQQAWHRPEVLVNAHSAVLADLPLKESLAEELAIEGHSSVVAAYIHRVKRHLNDLQRLPATIKALPETLLASITGAEPKELKTDTFGFRKLAVLATRNGRLIALDTSKAGAVVWNVEIPGYQPSQSLRLKASATGSIRLQNDGSHLIFDTATGKFLNQADEEASQSPSEDVRVQFSVTGNSLVGYVEGMKAAPLWRFSPANNAEIFSITTRPAVDPVASIGNALGDRRVLYKYLNSNLVLVTAIDRPKSTLTVYLLDSVSGKVLHEAEHPSIDASRSIAAVLSENWMAYSFSTLATSEEYAAQGPQLTVAELYESSIPDDRGVLGAAANYSALQPHKDSQGPFVVAQSYLLTEEISHMAVSQTGQGITTRLLMAVLPQSDAIIGIPRGAIDPRRVVGRDPTTNEQMEGLSKYLPSLEFNPMWSLNHRREVAGIENIITSPAVLESTSLVFAYGFDVFGTRVTPSLSFDRLGKDFNKIQMLGTVLALAVATLVVAPLVAKKQINTRWQIPS